MTNCAIPVVNLARLAGADYLPPMALAQCCRLGAAIVNGYIREDGTHEYLAPADLGLCFQAKEKLIEARVKAVTHNLNKLVVDCAICETNDDSSSSLDAEATSNPDTFAGEGLFRSLLNGAVSGLYTTDVWESVMPLVKKHAPRLCDYCNKDIKAEEGRQQREIFERLPELVGVVVEGWGTQKAGAS